MFDSFRAYGRNLRSLWVPPFGIICLYLCAGYAAVYLASLVCVAFLMYRHSGAGTSLIEISRMAREQPFSLPQQIVVGLLVVFLRGMIAVARQGAVREFLWSGGILIGIGLLLSSGQIERQGWAAVFGLGFWYFLLSGVFYEAGRTMINRKFYPEDGAD